MGRISPERSYLGHTQKNSLILIQIILKIKGAIILSLYIEYLKSK